MSDKKLLEEMEYWCRTALLSEIARLQDEVVRLKREVNNLALCSDYDKVPYPDVEEDRDEGS